MTSDQSIQVRYAGKALASEQECFWKVRVWDEQGKPSAWSQPARWTMGLLKPSDWHGKWIGLDEPARSQAGEEGAGRRAVDLVPGGPAGKGRAGRHALFPAGDHLPADRAVKRATLFFTADNSGEFFINGQKAGGASDFHAAARFDVTGLLQRGKNLLAASVHNDGSEPNPAGLIGLLRIEFAEGEPLVVVTDSSWKSASKEAAGWKDAGFDDAGWVAAQKLGPAGMAPWGEISGPEDRRLPARMLRREFAVEKKVRRATAYVCGLGLSEFYLNGKKVGDQVLSPALTDYTKRAFYVTFDVTKQLKQGANAVGVMLGNGRFYAPRSTVPTGTTSYGFPKLLFQMRIEYEDGTSAEVVSDETWKLTTDGPIRANNEYDGEEYDARMEMPGWSAPGFDDCAMAGGARRSRRPGGVLAAQMIEPIRVTETLKPIALTAAAAGRVHLRPGPEHGRLVPAEGVRPARARRSRCATPRRSSPTARSISTTSASAKVTDTYTLKGRGTEVYEPRFTYHGFRYVEVTGFPGQAGACRRSKAGWCTTTWRPPASSPAPIRCSTASTRTSSGACAAITGASRPIARSATSARAGWATAPRNRKGETYLFDTAALYAKWLQDMADAQKDNGSVPDVCPAYWPIYSDNVTWPSSTVIIPGALREQFADAGIIAQPLRQREEVDGLHERLRHQRHHRAATPTATGACRRKTRS